MKEWYYQFVNWLPWNQIYDLKNDLKEERQKNNDLVQDVFDLQEQVDELKHDLIFAAQRYSELKKQHESGS